MKMENFILEFNLKGENQHRNCTTLNVCTLWRGWQKKLGESRVIVILVGARLDCGRIKFFQVVDLHDWTDTKWKSKKMLGRIAQLDMRHVNFEITIMTG